MKLLLDTAIVLWLAGDDPRLSNAARQAYEVETNLICVSVVSIWEILVKMRLGKLQLAVTVEELLRSCGGLKARDIQRHV